ncbi:5606_t:CDS:1 [Dentiscutata heterogama]|uniref:5606_t:CDS:1 n=1 Tax=Dentiscutata heterogama TaxID=1316150 RepID=A0ACA9NVJ5_9GLOM|nr:5606_t:CDS:1 [Dentiscutata heterogama]
MSCSDEKKYTIMRFQALNELKLSLNKSLQIFNKNEDNHVVMANDLVRSLFEKAINDLNGNYTNNHGDTQVECEDDDKNINKRKWLKEESEEENESIHTKKARLGDYSNHLSDSLPSKEIKTYSSPSNKKIYRN